MLPRLAHKHISIKDSIGILCLLGLFFFSACSPKHQEEADRLNELSYAFHYRNLDSTTVFARRAMAVANGYGAGKAEAMNNLAFVSMSKMDYRNAYAQLDSIARMTDNQIELLIADIQLMRLCQRESRNKEFYDYYEQALRRMHRIDEEQESLSEHIQKRMVYARSEFDIVTSTYYYYVGLERQSVEAILRIDPDGELRSDTAQQLAYYYNVGAGGILTQGSQEEINQQEFDCLMRCYLLARQYGYVFWEANSLQAMSEHLQVGEYRNRLIDDNLPAMKFINIDNMPDSLLAGNLAQRSLDLFTDFGDVYQTAGSYRTLAQCYWQIQDYHSAIICLENALNANKAIAQAPDLVASIREQLSVTYSAINDKQKSDYNRNIYLDLQEQTRQDRYLESRADQLDRSSAQLNWMIAAVVGMIVAVIGLLVLFDWLRRRNDGQNSLYSLMTPLQEWHRRNEAYQAEMEEKHEEIHETYALNMAHLVNSKRRHLEQRAKVSLVNSITPFIDRILHEIKHLQNNSESEIVRQERYAYIAELTDQINDYNNVLTEWIQLRQGELSLHIESFPLQQLFDIVKKSRMSFRLKGIELEVKPSCEVVKADRILTLFMLNTIADNARKFTAEGGVVTISSETADRYVEISVQDTGTGIPSEQLEHLFDRKQIVNIAGQSQGSHGFGLMNCKGIIDKYKKISQIFSVCVLSAESIPGKGSRFFFRLPKGVVRLMVAVLFSLSSAIPLMGESSVDVQPFIHVAESYADSAYYHNVNGNYAQTLLDADSCRYYLNLAYQALCPNGKQLMKRSGTTSEIPAEIIWFHDSLPVNYQVVMDVRNESAVAALALHEWPLYRYNNKVYTQLFKETSADSRLGEYCRVMQKSETNKNVAIVILSLLLLSIFPAYYFIYYRHRLYYSFCVERVKSINEILLSSLPPEEKLASISPLTTDRFPEELRTIVKQITDALKDSIETHRASQTTIELAEDECRRAQMEDEKLHVSNSVLDNCLSTLKHETMYYPSRIRQLIDNESALTNIDGSSLENMAELAAYYKELYTLLSYQTMMQVNAIKLQVETVRLSELCPATEQYGDENECLLLGDRDMLKFLFDILQKQNGGNHLRLSVSGKREHYVEIGVDMPSLHLDEEQCLSLFTPSMDNLPYLLCRQIVRDVGESTNLRGCGIVAEPVEGGVRILITLARKRRLKN